MMGNNRQRFCHRPAGFSLLEVMVVIVIIAVIFSFATISLDTEPEKLEIETERLTSLMKMVAEEAVMNSRDYQLLLGESEYYFQVFSNGKWRDITEGILRRRQLPEGFSLSAEIENQFIPSGGSIDEEEKALAAILFLSSDESTPFEISISGPSGLERTVSNLSGQITTLPPTSGSY